jgi:hypothetical protein
MGSEIHKSETGIPRGVTVTQRPLEAVLQIGRFCDICAILPLTGNFWMENAEIAVD